MTDYAEFDIEPEKWIRRLLETLRQGTYEPAPPQRFLLAKGSGFSRRMAAPDIRDIVLFRALTESIYKKARRREAPNVYFDRKALARTQSKVSRESAEAPREQDSYRIVDRRRYLTWLRYNQYRKLLVLRKIYPYIVLTDVSNFFDSILYSRLADALVGLSVSERSVGLLFFILERLSVRPPYTESPRVGLPVDEFDCSRRLAHVVLFAHDQRMVETVGADAYVRWMDDQNFGVASRAKALSLLGVIGDSLSHLHLTPNVGKTKILTTAEARLHFHFPANEDLDAVERLPRSSHADRRRARSRLVIAWRLAKKREFVGEWAKILKRFYRLAALTGGRFLRRRATADILRDPSLADRVADYMRATGDGAEFLRWAERLWASDEQPYPDVNARLVETLLMVEPTGSTGARIRLFAASLLDRSWQPIGWKECVAISPLLLLRFGDARASRRLLTAVERAERKLPRPALKACAVVYASGSRTRLRQIQRAAAKQLANPLAEVARFLERLQEFDQLPGRFLARVRAAAAFDSLKGMTFLDMRGLVLARLLALNESAVVRKQLRAAKETLLSKLASSYDRALLKTSLQV